MTQQTGSERRGLDAVVRLRQVVWVLGYTTLSVFEGCDVNEIVAVCSTLIDSGWDLCPDDLTAEEFQMARFGYVQLLNEALERRLG